MPVLYVLHRSSRTNNQNNETKCKKRKEIAGEYYGITYIIVFASVAFGQAEVPRTYTRRDSCRVLMIKFLRFTAY